MKFTVFLNIFFSFFNILITYINYILIFRDTFFNYHLFLTILPNNKKAYTLYFLRQYLRMLIVKLIIFINLIV